MYEKRQLREFADLIAGEVEDRIAELGSNANEVDREKAFTQTALEYLEDNGMISTPVLCRHQEDSGHSRCRFTGFAVSDDGSRLEIFTTEYVSDRILGTLMSRDIAKLMGQATRLFARARKGGLDKFEGNQEAHEAAQRILREHQNYEDVKVYLLSNGVVKDRAVESIDIEGVPVNYEVIDIERLFRAAKSSIPRDEITIDFVKLMGRPIACLEMTPRPEEYETYLLILPGELLFTLYDTYGPRLLEYNVRSFLQARGNVNKGLRDTLRDVPERFMAYNNGLAATADEIEVGQFHGETTITKISGLQIVNGGQTTSSIHRAKKQEKIDISSVAVPVKLTKVTPERLEEFVPLISRYANTQNVIQVADLSANHKFHIEIERLSEEVWCPGEQSRWFYERARGQYQVSYARQGTTPSSRRRFKQETPSNQKFTKTDLAKYITSWNMQPQIVSKGAQKNFSIFMSELPDVYGENWLPDEPFYRELIAKAIIFKAVTKIVRQEAFPAYRANIVNYLTASLADRFGEDFDLGQVWLKQTLSPELIEMIRSWSHAINAEIIRSADGRNVTEWCKKDECWDIIKGLELEVPVNLPVEISETEHGVDHAPLSEDEQRILLCMDVTPHQWLDIHIWGSETGILKKWENGVSQTLSGYAAEGWKKKPSIKQAKIGARAVELAKSHGIIQNSGSS